jgi:hypothetical protein
VATVRGRFCVNIRFVQVAVCARGKFAFLVVCLALLLLDTTSFLLLGILFF